jgi:hypothetical protein
MVAPVILQGQLARAPPPPPRFVPTCHYESLALFAHSSVVVVARGAMSLSVVFFAGWIGRVHIRLPLGDSLATSSSCAARK